VKKKHACTRRSIRSTATNNKQTMKYRSQIITGACIAALAFCAPVTALARAKKTESPSPSASTSPTASAAASPANTERPIPYHGLISAVDTTAKTFTLAGKEKSRVIKITDKTILTKAGNPATMKDLVENEEVRGSYWKQADGTLEARKVKLGPLTEQEKAAEEARKAKRAEKKASASPSPTASASAKP
jgi:hypothetical protein